MFQLNKLQTNSTFTLQGCTFDHNFMDSTQASFLVKAQSQVQTGFELAVLDSVFEFNHGKFLMDLVLAMSPASGGTVTIRNVTFSSNALSGEADQSSELLYTEGIMNSSISDSLFSNTSNYVEAWASKYSLVLTFDALGLYNISYTQLTDPFSLSSIACGSQITLFEAEHFLITDSVFKDNLDCFTNISLRIPKLANQVLRSLHFYNQQLCIFIIHGTNFAHLTISQVSAQAVDRFLFAFYAFSQNEQGIQVELQNSSISDVDSQSTSDAFVIFEQGSFSMQNLEFSRIATRTSLMFVRSASLTVNNCSFTEIYTDSEQFSPVLEFVSSAPVNLTFDSVRINNTQGQVRGALTIQAVIDTAKITNSNFTKSVSVAGPLLFLKLSGGEFTFEDCSFIDEGSESNSKSSLMLCDLSDVKLVGIRRTTFLRVYGLAVLNLQSKVNSTVVYTEDCKFLDNISNLVVNRGASYRDSGSLMKNNTGSASTCYDGSLGSSANFSRTVLDANKNTFQGGLVTVGGFQDRLSMSGVVAKNSVAVSLGGVLYFKDDASALVEDSEFYNNTSAIASVLLSNNYKLHSVTLNNCSFTLNSGKTLVTVFEGNLIMHNCKFTRNSQKSIRSHVVEILRSKFYGDLLRADNLKSQGPGCFLSGETSNITVSQSSFSKFMCSSVIDVRASSLLIRSSEFFEGTQALTAVCSEAKPCNVSVSDSWIHDLNSTKGSRAISIAHAVGVFEGLVLSDFTIGGLAITETSASFANCSFFNLTYQGRGSAIQVQDSQSIVIETSTFQECKALQGTVDSQRSTLTLHNCEFKGCQAQSGGGLSLQGSSVNVSDCTFTNNSAVLQGGAIYWTDNQPLLTGVVFANNSAEYGADYATNMRDSLIFGQSMEVASGQLVQGGMEVVLVDVYGQQVTIDNSSTATLIPTWPLLTTGRTTAQATKGVFSFKDFSFIGSPNSTQLLEVASGSAALSVSVHMRNCVAGEAQLVGLCTVCQAGSYTLKPDSTLCRECPSNAVCLGGARVFPDEEYWRENNASDVLYKCFNPSACTGHDNYTSPTGKCATGYHDKLCSICDDGYSRGTGFSCNKCPQSKSTSASLLVLVVVCVIFVAALLVRSSVRNAVLMNSHRSVYIKILFNYLQVIGLIITAQLEWPDVAKQAFSAQDYSSNFPEHIFSLQCISGDSNISFFYTKLLPIALLPYLIILLSSGFWRAIAWMKNREFLYNQFTASVLILLLMVHPTFTKVMLSSFNCYEIGNEYWLQQDLRVKCWDYEHLAFSLGIGLTSVLVWSLALPLFIVNRIYRMKGRLDQISTRTKYGFMYIGYKHKFCYWEYVVILRKVFIVIPAVFLTSVSLILQAIVIHAVLLIALFIHEIAQPYNSKALNDLEFRSILVGLLSIYCGMSFLAGGLTEVGKVLMVCVLLVVNIYFILYWLRAFTPFLSLRLVSAFPSFFKRCCLPFIRQQAQSVLANDSRSVVSFSQLCQVKDAQHTNQLIELPVNNLQELYLLKLGSLEDDGVDNGDGNGEDNGLDSRVDSRVDNGLDDAEDDAVDDFSAKLPS
jgi:predicted outer membrane repeat protein